MATTTEELQAWMREYSDEFGFSFHTGDVSTMRKYCHLPSLRMTSDGPKALMTLQEMDRHWQAAHASLKPRDYHHSVLHTVDVTWLNPRAAFVTVDCSRYDSKGAEIMRFNSSYTVGETDQGWKITSWITHADRKL